MSYLLRTLLFGGLALWQYAATKRSIDVTYPAGSTARARLVGDELESATAIGEGRMQLGGIHSVHTTKNGILLVMRGSRAAGIMPSALLSGDDLERLKERVAALRKG